MRGGITAPEQLKHYQGQIEQALGQQFTGKPPYKDLYAAMRYSLLAGGKRIRPVLVLASCVACGGRAEEALPFACALEMVHTYSLIHDDLPCMDNDELRRGKPTCHVVYGEAMATLAGDALLTAAFGTLSGPWARSLQSPEQIAQATLCLARAAGEDGMVAGQVLDLCWEGESSLTQQQLEQIHDKKTGTLLRCACALGCIAAGGSREQAAALEQYATGLGLAFQIRDDILDVVGDADTLGKPIGSDAQNGKRTFVSLLGLEESQRLVEQLSQQATQALSGLQEPEFLQALARLLAGRKA